MNSSFPMDITAPDEPTGLVSRYFPAALLVSVLLHGVVVLLFYRFSPESDSPQAKIEKNISLTLISPIPPSIEQTQPPPDDAATMKPEAKPVQSEADSISQASKPMEASPLPEEQPARILITTPADEQKFYADHSVFISECTPMQRQSKIHRCSEANDEKWQAANNNTYQRAFAKNFQNLNQGSDFQQDMENIIRLITAQDSINALVESTGKESEMQKNEQLRISLEIDRLLDKNQALMQLIGVR